MRLSLWKTTSVRGVQMARRRKQSEEREENWPRKKSKETRERRRGNKEKKTKVHFNFSPFLQLFLKFYYSFFFLFIYSYFLILFRPVLHFAFRPSLSRKTTQQCVFFTTYRFYVTMLIIIWIFYMGIKFRDFFTVSKSANFKDPQKPVGYIKIRWIWSSNYIDRYETHCSIRE